MKRFIAVLLALLLLTACCAFAEEAAEEIPGKTNDVSGSWFGEMNGVALSLIFNEDGTYLFRVPGIPEADSSGTWSYLNGVLLLDKNADLPFYVMENTLYFQAMDLYLTRDEETGYAPDEILSGDDSDITLFQGAWSSRYVLMDGAVLPAEALQDDTILYVEGNKAALTGDMFGEIIADFSYENGAMVLATRAMTVTLEMQKDYMLRMTISSEGEALTYVLSPYMTEILTSSVEGEEAEKVDHEKAREFIERCYQNALGRQASAPEIEGWIGVISEGRGTPVDVAQMILSSDECQGRQLGNEDLVKAMYQIFFNHEPDPEGLAYWTEKLNSGDTPESVEAAFAASEEFKDILSAMNE